MQTKPNLFPAVAVRGIATGLILMSVFTFIWAGIAYGGLAGRPAKFGLLIFPLFIIAFIINAIKLFKASKHYPALETEADVAEGKKTGMWFGIIFGAEGLLIFVAVNLVTNLGHPDLVIPAIALVVGLHFYPLAKVFKRTIDYYLATWATVLAIVGIIFTLNKTYPQNDITAFVGIGFAIATCCYGTYMMLTGWKLEKPTTLQ